MGTSIEWVRNDDGTEGKSWNCVRGCSRISPGCGDSSGGGCYAERMAHRFSGKGQPYEGLTRMTQHGPRWTGEVRCLPEELEKPLHWRKPTRIFVNSMSDTFHDKVPDEFVAAVFGVMAACPQHTFIVLTKRAKRMRELLTRIVSGRVAKYGCCAGEALPDIPWMKQAIFQEDVRRTGLSAGSRPTLWPLPNVTIGVSTEDQKAAEERIPYLLDTPSACRMVSVEPMIGPVDMFAFLRGSIRDKALAELKSPPMPGVDVVVVGGESGPGARPCHVSWIRDIVRQCKAAGVCVFVKQFGADAIGADGKRIRLKHPKGGDMAEWPEDLRVRQWPKLGGSK